MRVLHFSDTHLGFQAFDQVDADGVNAREQDVYDAFERIITRILEIKPDLVIHSGDFFHRPSPSNRALTFALEQLRRMGKAGIPFVVIAGNHETPKTVYNSPILRALRSLDHIYPIFGDSLECHEFGQVAIHGLPHINDLQKQMEELEKLKPVPGRYNLLMLHTSLGKRYLMEEYGEQVFPPEFEAKLLDFQYIALGHWHRHQQVKLHPNAWYSGSIERLSETEIDGEKGYILLEIKPDLSASHHFEAMPTRPWHRLEIEKVHEKSISEIWTLIDNFIASHSLQDAIVSLVLNDIKAEQSFEFSHYMLQEKFRDCFQLSVKRKSLMERNNFQQVDYQQFDSLDKIFSDYLALKNAEQPELVQRLTDKARVYFEQLNRS